MVSTVGFGRSAVVTCCGRVCLRIGVATHSLLQCVPLQQTFLNMHLYCICKLIASRAKVAFLVGAVCAPCGLIDTRSAAY